MAWGLCSIRRERYPECTGNQAASVGYTLWDRIEPYLKSAQILKCPSDSAVNAFAGKSISSGAVTSWNTSYGYNYYHLQVGGSGNNAGVSLAAVQSLVQTVMIVDSKSPQDFVLPPQFWGTLGYGSYGSFADRHLDGGDVLWCDGHVKWTRPDGLRGPAGCTGAACNELWDLN